MAPSRNGKPPRRATSAARTRLAPSLSHPNTISSSSSGSSSTFDPFTSMNLAPWLQSNPEPKSEPTPPSSPPEAESSEAPPAIAPEQHTPHLPIPKPPDFLFSFTSPVWTKAAPTPVQTQPDSEQAQDAPDPQPSAEQPSPTDHQSEYIATLVHDLQSKGSELDAAHARIEMLLQTHRSLNVDIDNLKTSHAKVLAETKDKLATEEALREEAEELAEGRDIQMMKTRRELDALLLKMDDMRAKNTSLGADKSALQADLKTALESQKMAEMKTSQERTGRLRLAEVLREAQTHLEQMIKEREMAMSKLNSSQDSINSGKAVLSRARIKIADLTAANQALRAQVEDTSRLESTNKELTATVRDLRNQLAVAMARIQREGLAVEEDEFWWDDDERDQVTRREEERAARLREDERRQKEEADAKRRREEDARIRQETAKRLAAERVLLDKWRTASAKETERCRKDDETRFAASPSSQWTQASALGRFRTLLEEFGALKFDEQQPLTFASMPWPTLENPSKLKPGMVTWEATERFFTRAKPRMPATEFQGLVSKTQRTFHPDRHVAKLRLVLDEGKRKELAEMINVVSQIANRLSSA
ncbi:hypothetical protein CYLTODRAFT_374260 [Cylindrobasidium torrendii FP15055 ss-10]|uniref:Uncharacterized protein n=1 Tax=Cylindrobasidium torrendii FP15055 ss-10 TaxID=1314674 RepID=A0A0D7BDA6_9AGAR|nr:hypothetical protein CYLTODRAFT_374260 [Cylindrobasidium torrendii FP15055 ss-10]